MLIVDQRFAWSVQVLCVVPDVGGQVMQSKDIGKATGCKGRYLEPVLQNLAKHKMLTGKRGPVGGYALAVPPDTITLAQLQEAAGDLGRPTVRMQAPVADALRMVFDRWRGDLETITIADLREMAA